MPLSEPIPLLLGGSALVVLLVAVAYLVGRWKGARAANHLWMTWTGIEPGELLSGQFERELRGLRQRIGRPADYWPEQGRED